MNLLAGGQGMRKLFGRRGLIQTINILQVILLESFTNKAIYIFFVFAFHYLELGKSSQSGPFLVQIEHTLRLFLFVFNADTHIFTLHFQWHIVKCLLVWILLLWVLEKSWYLIGFHRLLLCVHLMEYEYMCMVTVLERGLANIVHFVLWGKSSV